MPENDEIKDLLSRIANAIERLSPPPRGKERIPATIGTACYSEEEKQKLAIKNDLKQREAQKQARRAT